MPCTIPIQLVSEQPKQLHQTTQKMLDKYQRSAVI
jgi:hypothetical protein